MGGAFDVNGNITPAAEANIHGDPEAADVVMTAPWPVTVVGLDVTTKTVMTKAMIADIAEQGGEAGKLLADISQFYVAFYEQHVPDGMVVHDSCACAYVVAPELFTVRSGSIRVVCGGIAASVAQPDTGRALLSLGYAALAAVSLAAAGWVLPPWGASDPATISGRQRLSSLLFA